MAGYRLWLLLSTCLSFCAAQNFCYSAENVRAGSAIVPCGGSGGISSCCQLGDLCLSDSACWNPTYNVTYLYGCTDITYTSTVCPYKCGPDFAGAPYVGLDYCSNTTNNEWSCTHPPNNSKAIEPFQQQDCYADSIVALAGPSSLQPILSLPTNADGTKIYFSQVNPTSFSLVSGYTPTFIDVIAPSIPTTVEHVSTGSHSSSSTSSLLPTTSTLFQSTTTKFTTTATKMSLTATGSHGTNTTPRASGTAQPVNQSHLASSSSSKGLSTGAMAGIGVGIAVIVCVIALLAFCLFWRRKRRIYQDAQDMSKDSDSGDSERFAIASYLKDGIRRQSGGFAPKAELEGTSRYTHTHTRDHSGCTMSTFRSELDTATPQAPSSSTTIQTPQMSCRWSVPSPIYPSGITEAGSDTIWEANGDHGAFELPGDMPEKTAVATKADTEGRPEQSEKS